MHFAPSKLPNALAHFLFNPIPPSRDTTPPPPSAWTDWYDPLSATSTSLLRNVPHKGRRWRDMRIVADALAEKAEYRKYWSTSPFKTWRHPPCRGMEGMDMLECQKYLHGLLRGLMDEGNRVQECNTQV